MANFKRISKLLALMLRHRPDEFGLDVDDTGFVPLDQVVEAIQSRYDSATEEDVRVLVEDSRQKRFEITERGVRALYGHTFYVEIDGEPMDPPEKLYMGCLRRDANRFVAQGIKPGDRFYVHLSLDSDTAAARSHEEGEPCVLEVSSRQASDQGCEFFARGEVVLTREIPADYVAFTTVPPSADTGPDPVASVVHSATAYGRRPRRGNRKP